MISALQITSLQQVQGKVPDPQGPLSQSMPSLGQIQQKWKRLRTTEISTGPYILTKTLSLGHLNNYLDTL